MQETFVSKTCVKCLHALEDADATLGSGGAAIAGRERLVDEIGIEVFELGAHAQEDLV